LQLVFDISFKIKANILWICNCDWRWAM